MALTASTAFLLLLGLMVSPVFIHSTAAADFNCTILNGNYNESSNFTLNVSSTTFNANQTYTVTVTGSGNVTVVLQAVWNSSNVGTWSAGANVNSNCTGNPVFQDPFQANGSLVANWTSPNQVANVVINAYIITDNVTYKNSKQLNAAPTTATTPIQTTNTASVKHPSSMFLALIETLGLLVITSKLLS